MTVSAPPFSTPPAMTPDQNLEEDAWGPLNPQWVPETPVDDGQLLVEVGTTSLYSDPLSGKLRGVAIDQGTPAWLKLVMTAKTGGPLAFSLGNYSTPPAVEVRYREAVGIGSCVFVPEEGDEATLSDDGTYLALPLPLEVKNAPGIYRGQTRVLRGDGKEIARNEFWVYVQRGMWTFDGSATDDKGPPTIDEVRTALRDHPGANRLLGEYEFDAAEISKALVAAIQVYNTTHPLGSHFDTRQWPIAWRQQWLEGALGYLFDTAATYCRRGSLPYAAGGISVNDLAKEKEYLTVAEMYKKRFASWCEIEKARQSVAAAFGSTGSGIPGWTYW